MPDGIEYELPDGVEAEIDVGEEASPIVEDVALAVPVAARVNLSAEAMAKAREALNALPWGEASINCRRLGVEGPCPCNGTIAHLGLCPGNVRAWDGDAVKAYMHMVVGLADGEDGGSRYVNGLLNMLNAAIKARFMTKTETDALLGLNQPAAAKAKTKKKVVEWIMSATKRG